jgi:putative ABC transport system permease protein
MRISLPLRVFRLVRRLLLPSRLASPDEAETLATARILAADARRRGRRASVVYWAIEFSSLIKAAVAARRRDPQLPDDLYAEHRSLPMLSTLAHDLRYAVRLLRRTPGFTAVALLTLALGIGANTAIFSLINGVLLQPLPYPGSDRLYRVLHSSVGDGTDLSSMTPGNFYDLKRDSSTMRSMAGVTRVTRTLTGRGEPQPISGMRSAGSILEVLDVAPLIGRIYTDQDDQPGAEPVVVLSHAAWMRLFSGDRSALGQPLVLDGQPITIIGVMPAGFQFPAPEVEFWTPAQFPRELRASRTEFMLFGIGRLADGREPREADAELQTIMARLRADHPQANNAVAIALDPLQEAIVGTVRTPLWILMASVACVLLIACANLANLMLARAVHRRREVALRQAIGAGRAHIVRQLLTESLVLGIAGGVAGLLTGYVFLRALIAWLPEGTPRLSEVTLDPSVLVFTLLVAVGSSVGFGLAPALQLSGSAPASTLKETASNTTLRSRLRPALVVCEVAVALVLLAGAGLLLRSFQALQHVDPGFPVDRVLTFAVNLPTAAYPRPADRIAFVRDAITRLESLPGVESAAAGSSLPLAGRGNGAWFNMLDRPVPPGQTPPGIPYRVITTGYFKTVGIRLVRGRLLGEGDGSGGTPSVVVSESVAKRFWPEGEGRDAIGSEIYLGAPDNRLFDRATVVGVVKDVKLAGLDSGITEAVYGLQSLLPFWRGFTFVLRTSGDPTALVAAARHEIRQIDPTMPVTAVRTMSQMMEGSMAPARSSMLLLTIFAGVALAMAAVGVFGVLSFNVTRRSREMGIRMALGADAGALRRLVVGEGMMQASAGIALGLLGAFWLTSFMSTLLFEVPPRDPLTFAGAACVLAAVSALACYLPARRATRVNPLVVLRSE